MIKAKDLMIGDWVKSRGKIEQVTSVYDGYICTDSFEDSHDYYFDPIPLTPEILEKNGFEKVPQEKCVNPFYWRFDKIEDGEYNYSVVAYKTPFRGFFFEIKNNCDCEPIVFTKQMEPVHELQHALRLCGIKKEIEL